MFVCPPSSSQLGAAQGGRSVLNSQSGPCGGAHSLVTMVINNILSGMVHLEQLGPMIHHVDSCRMCCSNHGTL